MVTRTINTFLKEKVHEKNSVVNSSSKEFKSQVRKIITICILKYRGRFSYESFSQ